MLVRRDTLGAKLREIRAREGYTGADLARALGYSQSKISKIETGHLKPTVEFIRHFAKRLKLSAREREYLESLLAAFQVTFERWTHGEAGTLANLQSQILRAESRAQVLRGFQWALPFGLTQTPDYMRFVFSSSGRASKKDIDGAIAVRLERQKILASSKKTIQMVTTEHALVNKVVPTEVLKAQLSHLESIITNPPSPKVELRILAKETLVPVICPTSFWIHDAEFVSIETLRMNIDLWDPDDVQTYVAAFDRLWETSAASSSALQVIARARTGLEGRSNG